MPPNPAAKIRCHAFFRNPLFFGKRFCLFARMDSQQMGKKTMQKDLKVAA